MNRKVSVAPMMDCTDRHERYFLRLISKNTLLYTEMIVDEAINRGDKKKLLEFNMNEKPVALQIGGSSPKLLAEASKIGEEFGYDEINLNLGCPSKKVEKNKFGACLMKEPYLVADCLSKMQASTKLPVTIKTRIGYDNVEDYENFHNFISVLKSTGIKTFIIHARKAMLGKFTPKQNLNIPPLKYNYVYDLKKDFPNEEIIINGGITSVEEINNHLDKMMNNRRNVSKADLLPRQVFLSLLLAFFFALSAPLLFHCVAVKHICIALLIKVGMIQKLLTRQALTGVHPETALHTPHRSCDTLGWAHSHVIHRTQVM